MSQSGSTYETVQISYKSGIGAGFLYKTLPGRILLRGLVKTPVSKVAGMVMDSPASRVFVRGFVKKNNINMDDYQKDKFRSFNDFFVREIKTENRFFPDNEHSLTAPCDGKLSAYPITSDGVFKIKNSIYSIEDLLQDKSLAHEFIGGLCLIFRLTPDDYHRYAYIDDGESICRRSIKGVLHTVRPIAQHRYKVFIRNTREYEVLQTAHFGKVIQMEVGAMFVGRITNHNNGCTFKRGDEKGMFKFGGSTIVMLFEKNVVTLDSNIISNTHNNKETIIKMGCEIGEALASGR